ncbi:MULTISPECIES: glycosyltransferase [unclassified Haematospirillum]|uniref:glycosyltransferase n=1 Tax=unclassified Haematospirillum TaxID=2622088 RepID=UPI00143ADF44|nr:MULTISPECIES: glycosyltransferase [unclassified Haematospirillum]NKD56039.1 glycosyltransferase [Haematospirillum sp. H4890]NKD76042.1 glycosyltransferase [Haematospirillum sp. H4485]
MRVVHLSHTDGGAGAGRAVYRIHAALCELGVDSRMLVSRKRTADPSVQAMSGSGLGHWRVSVAEYLEARAGRALARDASVFLSPALYGYFHPMRAEVVRGADVVAIYWINGAFITLESLAGINKPLVWRLSDVWPFTGGCHYPGTCERFENQCGDCPQLRQPGPEDATHRLWLRKKHAWRTLDLTVVAPSNWIAGLARRSSLFADWRVEVIPTGVDLERYCPGDRSAARARWGLPQDRLLILFGAMSPTDDVRKGYRELRRALEVVAQSPLASRILAVVFGSDVPLPADLLPVPAVSLGRLEGDEVLKAAYNCADVVVVPSLEDNLPNVALEAIACGAPVAAFDVCGMPDIVTDSWNGRLIPQADPEGLGWALVEILSDSKRLLTMRFNARQRAQQSFSLKDQANAYRALYEQILARRPIKDSQRSSSGGLN